MKRAARSGVGIGSVGGHKIPRTEVQVPQRSARMTKDCSPHGGGQRSRRSYRKGR